MPYIQAGTESLLQSALCTAPRVLVDNRVGQEELHADLFSSTMHFYMYRYRLYVNIPTSILAEIIVGARTLYVHFLLTALRISVAVLGLHFHLKKLQC